MSKIRSAAADLIIYVIGSFLFAVSVNTFSAPNNIIIGGFTGIGIILNHIFNLPIGTVTFVLNIPLFIWGYKKCGHILMIKTMTATLISSALIDISEKFLPIYNNDIMLASIFSGVLSGIGLGLIFYRNATTGGAELAATLISIYFPAVSVGTSIFVIDAVILAFSAFIYKSIESPMYALIIVYISTKIIDRFLYGQNEKLLLIISDKYMPVKEALINKIGRGVTLLSAKGGYYETDTMAILCAADKHDAYKIYPLIKNIDRNSFIITLNASEIYGNGFREK